MFAFDGLSILEDGISVAEGDMAAVSRLQLNVRGAGRRNVE